MKLTQKQSQILKQHLEVSAKACAVCGGNQVNVSDKIFELREFQGGNLVIGGESSVLPVAVATCQKCGHTHFFSAVLLGLIATQSIQDEKENKD